MTDKLPPAHLRDLADVIEGWEHIGPRDTRSSILREEAARREAEAKPEGPVCFIPNGCPACSAFYGDNHTAECPQGQAKAAIEAQRLGQTLSREPLGSNPIVEREGLDSADAELVKRLRGSGWHICNEAADRIEAQAREIAAEVSAKFQWANAYERALGDYHTVRKERETLKARVAELGAQEDATASERDDALARYRAEKTRAEQAEAKAARLVAHISNTLAMFDCAGLPTNPDSLPQMVKRELKAMLAEAGHAGT